MGISHLVRQPRPISRNSCPAPRHRHRSESGRSQRPDKTPCHLDCWQYYHTPRTKRRDFLTYSAYQFGARFQRRRTCLGWNYCLRRTGSHRLRHRTMPDRRDTRTKALHPHPKPSRNLRLAAFIQTKRTMLACLRRLSAVFRALPPQPLYLCLRLASCRAGHRKELSQQDTPF